jgi:hypothetical protein
MTTDNSSFALMHQIFVLDAHLQEPLDTDAHLPITQNFIAEFLSVLGLEPLGPLGIYPAVDDRAPGWSFIQPITTSHISAHYFEKPGNSPHIRIDAYSCDEVNWRDLVQVCHRHFNLADWRGTFIDREIDWYKSRLVQDIKGVGNSVSKEHLLDNPATVSLTAFA